MAATASPSSRKSKRTEEPGGGAKDCTLLESVATTYEMSQPAASVQKFAGMIQKNDPEKAKREKRLGSPLSFAQ
jgi:hypothetical protein